MGRARDRAIERESERAREQAGEREREKGAMERAVVPGNYADCRQDAICYAQAQIDKYVSTLTMHCHHARV